MSLIKPQWRNRLARGTYKSVTELCRGCEFEPHRGQVFYYHLNLINHMTNVTDNYLSEINTILAQIQRSRDVYSLRHTHLFIQQLLC